MDLICHIVFKMKLTKIIFLTSSSFQFLFSQKIYPKRYKNSIILSLVSFSIIIMVLAGNLPRAIWHFCTLPKFIFICTAATAQNCTQCQCICNANCALCTVHSTPHSIHLSAVHCSQCTAQYALCTAQCALCTVQCAQHCTQYQCICTALHSTALYQCIAVFIRYFFCTEAYRHCTEGSTARNCISPKTNST